MPEFAHADRNMIEAENSMWNVYEILGSIETAGSWAPRIDGIRLLTQHVAEELRNYNDQFETAD